MPSGLRIVAGPAGAGKSQNVAKEGEPGDVLIDYPELHAAVFPEVERNDDGKYPERTDADPRIGFVQAVKDFAVKAAVVRGLRGFVTTSNGSRRHLSRLAEDADVLDDDLGTDWPTTTGSTRSPICPAWTSSTLANSVIRRRLAGLDGGLFAECERAVDRWYGRRGRRARTRSGARSVSSATRNGEVLAGSAACRCARARPPPC